jgi:hypothetical protein
MMATTWMRSARVARTAGRSVKFQSKFFAVAVYVHSFKLHTPAISLISYNLFLQTISFRSGYPSTTTTEAPSTTEAATRTTVPLTTESLTTTEVPATTESGTTIEVGSSTAAPFVCPSEGKHPDPLRCNVFHECVKYQNGFLDYEITCPEFTFYCAEEEICGNPDVCPCELESSATVAGERCTMRICKEFKSTFYLDFPFRTFKRAEDQILQYSKPDQE